MCMLVYYKATIGDIPILSTAGHHDPRLQYCTRAVLVVLVGGSSWRLLTQLLCERGLGSVVAGVVLAPFAPVTFFHSFIADTGTSLVKVWQDVAWSACFFLSGDWLLNAHDYAKLGGAWRVSSVAHADARLA